MAQPWAKKFYNSKAWKLARDAARRRDQYTCRRCGARGYEVHHTIELTPENINDPSISLNIDLLETLCGDCHKKETNGQADVADGYCFDDDGQMVPTR